MLHVTSCCTALFADDAKRFNDIKSDDNCILMQSNLDSFYRWSLDWGVSFNISKCKFFSITSSRRKVNYNYSMNGIVLEHVYRHL